VRVTRTWRLWACELTLAVALLVVVCGSAHAYSIPSGLSGHEAGTVCPPRPADAGESATPAEVDLVTIAQELADSCYRREQLAEQAHTDSGAVVKRLGEQLTTAIAGEPTVKVGNWEAAPASSTVELSAGAKAELDGNAQAIHDDLWFAIGALLAVAVVGVLYAEIRPKR
jgi:hypothetical protein